MSNSSEERINEVHNTIYELGYDGAAEKLGIARETVRRYERKWKAINNVSEPSFDENLMRQLGEKFSEAELRKLLQGSDLKPDYATIYNDFQGDEITIGGMTDTHLGSVYTNPDMIFRAFDVFAAHGVDFLVHCGDVHEGMSNRPGHVYECSHIGYSAQLDHSREVFGQWKDTDVYMIDGNHDRWFIKSNGALIVKELCDSHDNLHFLGHDEGDINIQGKTIKLWHGEDGSSYAYSYRIQKIIESFTGGEKPNVFLCGHTHKALPMYDRHVHCCSLGAIQRQSKWMRGKRHASHTGFFVIRMGLNDTGVSWFEPRFFPFYQ
jgi:predicted phosphodiesterase